MPYTRRARRDEPLCLHLLGSRRCIAADQHEGQHHFSPLPRPGRLTGNDLYLEGVREGIRARRYKSGEGATHMLVVHIFHDGIIVMRSMTVGTVFFVTGETFFKNYVIMR